MKPVIVLVGMIAWIGGEASHATETPPPLAIGHPTPDRNQDEQRSIEGLLRERDWEHALSVIDSQVDHLIVAESDAEAEWAHLFALRALASAEAGDQAEAFWDWDIAAQANADVATSTLDRIGVPRHALA